MVFEHRPLFPVAIDPNDPKGYAVGSVLRVSRSGKKPKAQFHLIGPLRDRDSYFRRGMGEEHMEIAWYPQKFDIRPRGRLS